MKDQRLVVAIGAPTGLVAFLLLRALAERLGFWPAYVIMFVLVCVGALYITARLNRKRGIDPPSPED